MVVSVSRIIKVTAGAFIPLLPFMIMLGTQLSRAS